MRRPAGITGLGRNRLVFAQSGCRRAEKTESPSSLVPCRAFCAAGLAQAEAPAPGRASRHVVLHVEVRVEVFFVDLLVALGAPLARVSFLFPAWVAGAMILLVAPRPLVREQLPAIPARLVRQPRHAWLGKAGLCSKPRTVVRSALCSVRVLLTPGRRRAEVRGWG